VAYKKHKSRKHPKRKGYQERRRALKKLRKAGETKLNVTVA